jgi:hypothetical protein
VPGFTLEMALILTGWTYKFTLASAVYFTLSTLFPANDTMLDHVILADEALSDDRSYSNSGEKKDDAQAEEAMVT